MKIKKLQEKQNENLKKVKRYWLKEERQRKFYESKNSKGIQKNDLVKKILEKSLKTSTKNMQRNILEEQKFPAELKKEGL